jgi:hypothetical protein
MIFSFLPNSVVNDAISPADYESPYSFLAFIQYQDFNTLDVNAQLKDYQNYINVWASKKNLKKSQENSIVRDAYINLMREITLNFSTEEERKFILNADFNDDSDLDIIIPFFIQKIKQISFYYKSKRQEVKNSLIKHNLKGSNFGVENIVKNLIYEYIETNLDTKRKELSGFYKNFEISITELYGDSDVFYDKPEDTAYSFTNKIDPNIFINIKQSVIDAISAYPMFLENSENSIISEFTINQKLSGTEYQFLKSRDFIDYIKNDQSNLKLNLFKNLYPKYTGTDYYYISTNSNNQILSGLLFDAEKFNGQYLNKHFPTTIISQSLEDLYSAYELGASFLPQNQGFLIYNVPAKKYEVDKGQLENDKVYVFPDPDKIGNTIYTSEQENNLAPVVYSIDTSWNRVKISNGFRINDVLSNNYDKLFYGYQSKEQNTKLSTGGIAKITDNITFWGGDQNQIWEGSFDTNIYPIDQDLENLLLNEGVAVDWYPDEFNNEFALYKKINTYRKQTGPNPNDGGLIPDSDTEFQNLSTNNVSLYDKKTGIKGKIFVRNNFYKTVTNIKNALSSVLYKYPDFVTSEVEDKCLKLFVINNVFVIETENYVISDSYAYDINNNAFNNNNTQPFYVKKERVIKNLETFINPWYDEKYQRIFLVFLTTVNNSLSSSNYKYITPEIYSTKTDKIRYEKIYPTASTVTTIYSLSSPFGTPPEINLVEYSGGSFRKNSPLNEFNLTYMAKNLNSVPFIINEKLFYTPQNNTFVSEYPLLLKPYYFIYDNNYSNPEMPYFLRYSSNRSGYVGLKNTNTLNIVDREKNKTNYAFSSNVDVLHINECGRYVVQFDWESYNDTNIFVGCSSFNVKRVADNLLLRFQNNLFYLSAYEQETELFQFNTNDSTFSVKAKRPTFPYNEVLSVDVQTTDNTTFTGTFCGDTIYRKIKIIKTGVGDGQVIADPPCLDCGNDCEYLYPLDSTVTLIASAGRYSEFRGWGGDSDCVGFNSDCIFKVDDDKTVYAEFDFLPLYFLSVDSGIGKVVSFDGNISCPTKCFSPYPERTYITLSASPAPEGYLFRGFTNIPCTQDQRVCTFIIYGTTLVEALYSEILYYTLNLSVLDEVYDDSYLFINTPFGEVELLTNPNNLPLFINKPKKGSIRWKSQYDLSDNTCPSNCTPSLSENTLVSITATPESGFIFDKWTGGPCDGSNNNVCTFVINQDYSIIANFKIPTYFVTIVNVGNGVGRSYSSPNGIDCTPNSTNSICTYEFVSGSNITIFANSSAGSNYLGLSSYQIGNTTSNSITFNLTGNVVLSAYYVAINYYNLRFFKGGINVGDFFTIPESFRCGINCTNSLSSFVENSQVRLDGNIAPNRQIYYYDSTRPITYRYVAGNGVNLTGDGILISGEFFTFSDNSFVITNVSMGTPYAQGNDGSVSIKYQEVDITMSNNISVTAYMI